VSDPFASPAVSSEEAVVGERLLAHRYRLDHQLAVGGMAEVWVAYDKVLGRKVAVKMLKPNLARDPVFVERFRREAVAAARLSHPSIVAVFDTVSENEAEAVVMELVQGRTLRQVLDAQGRLSVADTVRIGAAVAAALDAAHRADIVHRDVKPGNVLLSNEGRVLLSDFGIAKALSASSDLTSDNIMLGTAKYLSPEQVTGARIDPRSDLYSLAVVLYESLTGSVPFVADTDAATALMRLRREPMPIRSIRPGVPRPLDDLVLTSMARDPARRPASAAVFRDALLRVNAASSDDATSVAGPGPARADVRTAPSPATATSLSVIPEPARPDRTPSSGIARPQPNEQRWLVPAVTIVLIALGLGVAGVLIGSTDTGSRFIRTVREAVTGEDTGNAADSPDDEVPVENAGNAGPATLKGTAIYDPPPGDRAENSGQVGNLFDQDPSTMWSTERYNNAGMLTGNGDKPGVGVIVELDVPANGHELAVTSPTRGWAAQVYVSDAPHEELAAWGAPVAEVTAIAQDTTPFALKGDGDDRYVLFLVTDLGDGTTNEKPFRVEISTLAIS